MSPSNIALEYMYQYSTPGFIKSNILNIYGTSFQLSEQLIQKPKAAEHF